ncbi:aspartate/glutamate racemase family protein [Paracraurococcus ruber]|uniref:Aspartate/glutamate racemase family protein n=2 Tax=Paracraurococcus ruber TaxID=77675 RepID=A0ABS1D7E3_9PROT|nr:aspartate/glutamate racemase family protein [Paracraurococcus ruber]MBK1662729.1 hypothetical protein [Paracraurococcus ruber]TDG05749.1 aspartate/glutamate racemase family protein [Paracraurococcus ruber]
MARPHPRPIAPGGRTVFGAPVGILMLETRFPRIPGDIGHAGTWPFPVLYQVVRGASPARVVEQGGRGLLPDFIAAGQALVATGADAITTSCGFLVLFQAELQAALGVPVATSALLQIPWVQAMLPPGRRVGVLTASRAALTPAHLAAAGAPADTPVGGLEGGTALYPVLVRQETPDLDPAAAAAEVVAAGHALAAAHPDLGAIVLECTNLPPYAAALRAALGLPVFDIVSLVIWLRLGVQPGRFPALAGPHGG